MPLDPDDARAVLEAATRMVATPTPGFATVLELLGTLIPCRSASFNDMAFATGDFRYLIVPSDEETLARRLKPAYDRFAHQHPLIALARHPGTNGALRFCDATDTDFLATDLYREFYRPFGLRYQLVIELPSPPDVVVGYALNRTPDQGEFSDRDVEVLNALEGHLAMHHRMTMDIQRANAMTGEADRDGWTVVTVRSDGVVDASSSAISSSALSSVLASGRHVPPEVAALLPTELSPASDRRIHDLVLGDTRWRCAVHPVALGPTVLLIRRVHHETTEAAPLIDVGLTPRQSDVARALGRSGGTNAQLARELGMSEGTVKKHLETVFRVLAVDNRAAAVAALRPMMD